MNEYRLISKDSSELSVQFADWLVEHITAVLKKQDRYTFALSGGSTPKKLYQLLASDKYRDRIDWPKLHFFWGDERFVPFADDRNNARMAYETLLDLVPINKSQVYVMKTHLEPAEAVADYESILHRYFDGHAHSFDLVLLGLGDNAHTLSLFPGYDVVHEMKKWVAAFYLHEQSMYRITLTASIVNNAARVAFMASGADKATAVKEVLEGPADADKYPAQVIRPLHDKAYWFLDEAAASGL